MAFSSCGNHQSSDDAAFPTLPEEVKPLNSEPALLQPNSPLETQSGSDDNDAASDTITNRIDDPIWELERKHSNDDSKKERIYFIRSDGLYQYDENSDSVVFFYEWTRANIVNYFISDERQELYYVTYDYSVYDRNALQSAA